MIALLVLTPSVFFISIAGVFGLGLLAFCVQHYRLACMNVTTIEQFEKVRIRRNTYIVSTLCSLESLLPVCFVSRLRVRLEGKLH
jgi:hypothetical protein